MKYQYAVTERGHTPSERAIIYPDWTQALMAIEEVKLTTPSGYMDDQGEVHKRELQFDIHARRVDPWKVVTDEPTTGTKRNAVAKP